VLLQLLSLLLLLRSDIAVTASKAPFDTAAYSSTYYMVLSALLIVTLHTTLLYYYIMYVSIKYMTMTVDVTIVIGQCT
jgi:hypothetical protein